MEEVVEKKPTYDQLVQVIQSLKTQNTELYEKLVSLDMSNILKRLEFLFKAVEMKDSFDEDFVKACKKEIVDLMTIPEKTEEEEPKEEVTE